MNNFEIIAELDDLAMVRVLCSALRAHGFHPLESGEDGLPGMPGIAGVSGLFPVRVPADEARDARSLAEVLVAEMKAR